MIVSNLTFFSYRHVSTLDTSGKIMDFSWYTFTTGGPAPVLRLAMAARAQARWLEELKEMVCKRGDPTVIVLILEVLFVPA